MSGAQSPAVPALRRAHIDHAALAANLRHVLDTVRPAAVMAVVKADAYGHGAVEVARTAVAAGAEWLGVADVDEALALRDAGIEAPVLAWLHGPDPDFAEAVARDVTLGISTAGQLARAVAAGAPEAPARVHLKVDTGLGRNGLGREEWRTVFEAAAAAEAAGRIRVEGLFSHLSGASPDDDLAQLAAFEEATSLARSLGLDPGLRHLASTAGALSLPATRLDLVRLGIGLYGHSPFDDRTAAELGLVPAMRLESRLISVKHVAAGTGVSYGYTHHVERDSWLGLVPLGYADGIPRHVSNTGSVWVGGRVHPIVGRVAMDQFVVELGEHEARVGDRVVLFGDPSAPEAAPERYPGADDWARAASTITWEIVTRLGRRVERVHS
ncbi:alanine racemase [Herbiconiux moechotypicola]|uniref:Alanine racemase n=1 Tax=Herbiconiux moechotypicola TaxID=637393 RepID=A0ABN3DTK7_9MICO|nr:alanine racemase [Herbiconiux moechotypicola]MCS5730572.1 alanine racemase [Herbiconiux moechotypicola]